MSRRSLVVNRTHTSNTPLTYCSTNLGSLKRNQFIPFLRALFQATNDVIRDFSEFF